MSQHEDTFIPEDPSLYGPDPGRRVAGQWSLSSTLGLTAAQGVWILTISMLIFAFLGGPFWSSPRQAFTLRVIASYLILPPLVFVCLLWNRKATWATLLFASSVLGSVKFAITVVIDVVHGLLRHWPP